MKDFIQHLEKKAREMDDFESLEGSGAFNRKYSHSGRKRECQFVDNEARFSSEKRCRREEATANRELTKKAKEIDSTTFHRMAGDSITIKRAIGTLNRYHYDAKARRSSRKQKLRKVDTSTGYSFPSDSSSDSENDDDDGEDEGDSVFDCESFPQDNKSEDDDDALDDDASGSSRCYSDCSSVFSAPQQKNKLRRIFDDSDDDADDDNDDDRVLWKKKRRILDDSSDDDDVGVEDGNNMSDGFQEPFDDDDSPGGDGIPVRLDQAPSVSSPMPMQLTVPIVQVPMPMMSVPLYPHSFYPQLMAPPVPYQHQYVPTQGHVPGLSVSTHVPDLSNKHTENWLKKYNIFLRKSQEDGFVCTREFLSFSLYDWFSEQKKQKRARQLSPWKQQYLNNVLGSNDW